MKAFLNPLLLVICVLLLAFGYASSASGEEGGSLAETWVLTLCLLGAIINGTLGVARVLTRRPAVACIAWAVGYLLFGSMAWVFVSGESTPSLSAQERALLEKKVEAWQAGQLDPYAPDDNGDSVLTLAAGLGRMDILHKVSTPGHALVHAEAFARAAHRAAERDRAAVLEQFADIAYVPVDARAEGMTPLHTAALHKARRAAAELLERGADVHAAAVDGLTPLHNAVLVDDEAMVHLLLEHGADPKRVDADGRDAASYARSEGILNALESSAAPAVPPAP